jgi:hypothetical protein
MRMQLQLKLIYDRQSVGQSVMVSGAHLGPVTNFSFSLKFLLDSYGFLSLKRPLWREDGSVIYCTVVSGPCLSSHSLSRSPVRVRVRVTLQMTVSQSVCLGVEPNLGLLTRNIYFFFESYSLVLFGAPSLTRGRVCHLSVYSQSTVVSQYLHKIFTYCVSHLTFTIFTVLDTFTIKDNKIQYVQYVQASFSSGSVQQIMP